MFQVVFISSFGTLHMANKTITHVQFLRQRNLCHTMRNAEVFHFLYDEAVYFARFCHKQQVK